MGLFKRNREIGDSRVAINPSDWIGRKFRTETSIDESISNFMAVAPQCYPVAGDLDEIDWTVPKAEGFQSTESHWV